MASPSGPSDYVTFAERERAQKAFRSTIRRAARRARARDDALAVERARLEAARNLAIATYPDALDSYLYHTAVLTTPEDIFSDGTPPGGTLPGETRGQSSSPAEIPRVVLNPGTRRGESEIRRERRERRRIRRERRRIRRERRERRERNRIGVIRR